MSGALLSGLLATVIAMPARAEQRSGGIELGLRTGYGGQGGTATGTDPIRNAYIPSLVPVLVDGGYRFGEKLFVGAFFQYAFGLDFYPFPATDCRSPGVDCSGRSLRLGLEALFHYAPKEPYDPWLGAGVGYEWANVLLEHGSADLQRMSLSASGPEMFNVQVGLDFHLGSGFAAGPFASFSFNQYRTLDIDCRGSICSSFRAATNTDHPSTHEWLIAGVRGVYLLGGEHR